MIPLKNPCRDGKCISYPVCINKRVIDCDKLDKWYTRLEKKYEDDPIRIKNRTRVTTCIWKELKPILPKIAIIVGILNERDNK